MRPVRAALVRGLVAVLVGVLVAGCGGNGGARRPDRGTPHPAEPAGAAWFDRCPSATGPARGPGLPDVRVRCFRDGHKVRLDSAFGRPLVLNLWASWCQPCRRELPEMARYARSHPDVRVLTVDTRDRRTAGLAFARDAGVRLPTLFDGDGAVLSGLGRTALPVTVLVEPDGRVAYTYNSTALTARTLDGLVARHLKGER